MLSDHEWQTLRAVERQFVTDDPEFTRSFDMRAQRLRRKDHDRKDHGRELVKIAVVGVVLLCALMLVAGSPSGALAFAATAGLIWLARRNSIPTAGRGDTAT